MFVCVVPISQLRVETWFIISGMFLTYPGLDSAVILLIYLFIVYPMYGSLFFTARTFILFKGPYFKIRCTLSVMFSFLEVFFVVYHYP